MLKFIEPRLGRFQKGFRHSVGTRDAITIVRALIHLLEVDDRALFALLIDYRAAFDSVAHRAIMETLEQFQVPKTLQNIIDSLYSQCIGQVKVRGG